MKLESAIVKSLEEVIGESFTYVLTNRDGVEPQAGYILVDMFPRQKLGQENREAVTPRNGDSVQVIVQNIEQIIRLTLHSKATDEKQDIFADAQLEIENSFEARNKFYHNGIAVVGTKDLFPVATPIETQNYRRLYFDLVVRYSLIAKYGAYTIDDVEVGGYLFGAGLSSYDLEKELDDGLFLLDSGESIGVEIFDEYSHAEIKINRKY